MGVDLAKDETVSFIKDTKLVALNGHTDVI